MFFNQVSFISGLVQQLEIYAPSPPMPAKVAHGDPMYGLDFGEAAALGGTRKCPKLIKYVFFKS